MSTIEIPTNVMDVSETETEDGEIPMKDSQIYCTKKVCWSIAVGLFCIIAIIIGISTFSTQNDAKNVSNNNMNQNDAFDVMSDLMQYRNLTIVQKEQFQEVFKVFDQNNDGYLNETEFISYFELQLNLSNEFQRVDVDKDDIISYPEAVTYLMALNNIPEIKQNSIKTLTYPIEMNYGYKYYENNSSFNIFIEYMAMLMYFERFDIELKGYIHHNDFLLVSSKDEFKGYDGDYDGLISYNEFYNILYGTDQQSWNGQLHGTFGDDYKHVLNELSSIVIDEEMVINIQLNLCPFQVLNNDRADHTRTRLVASTHTTEQWDCWRCGSRTCCWCCY